MKYNLVHQRVVAGGIPLLRGGINHLVIALICYSVLHLLIVVTIYLYLHNVTFSVRAYP